ncbi:MAG TPA: bifunctional phosphopantothenoylcysteine decarboxylase/phosphopantothenate--cysteine ligase CoaBC [Nitrospirota bacterium]|nr:bifunctional phosphopantothenoylcysteine decarboxylase/phosphopantothenate--cysteine ligase CoaBC [Nitrospirota bacterium]
MLSGKRILLGVTGSIAAYKAVDVLRRLKESGADVRVVMTKNATRFVAPLTFEALSGRPVLCDEFLDWGKSSIGHIDVSANLDLALIAPATANVIGKAAAGIADDALTSALMALECPVMMAPAMNDRMYRNPALRRNIQLLKEQGVRFIEPEAGPLACGTTGQGRLADPLRIVQEVSSMLASQDFTGVTILVTAGPTREPIDTVRFISNPSSGKMGYAIAAAARDRGAQVVLISGPSDLPPPYGVKTVQVLSADDMYRAVMGHIGGTQIVIMAAAVSDFKTATFTDRKIKKQEAPTILHLEPTRDILLELGKAASKRFLVGFAAETDNIRQNALKKLQEKNLDMIVANDLMKAGAGFGADTNAVTIIDRNGTETELPVMPKSEIAAHILDKILELKAN